MLISLFRWSYETVTGALLRSMGVRRRALLVGDAEQVGAPARDARLRAAAASTTSSSGELSPGPALTATLARERLDELIVADSGLGEEQLLEIVEAAQRRGVQRAASRRGRPSSSSSAASTCPGQAAAAVRGARRRSSPAPTGRVKRTFDVVVAALVLVLGLPVWLLIALLIKLDLARPGLLRGRARRPRRAAVPRCSSSARWSRARTREQAALESANEASGALFKIRNDPRVTRVGRILRRFSIDEIPNADQRRCAARCRSSARARCRSRDYEQLEPWHRRRSNVLPGMTGLWQIAGRSDLSFDDLVRLDFYYLENWSLWLDITILVRTIPAVVVRRGAY